ncbi:hypothetical protein N9E25_07565 [Verrucomicrobiales bacterium]|nr:hypothetical protein [Verrucomicrobiales bacterium]
MANFQKIWSFDIGTGSIGYAVRGYSEDPNQFSEVDVLLIPDEFASIKGARTRRRMKRTRDAHKAREAWLRHVFEESGIETLHGRVLKRVEDGQWDVTPGDERLEREFPARGEETVYCGAALRAMLLRGEKLEEWQLFKAFHSAIQKRGYDANLPWKSGQSAGDGDEEEETRQRCDEFSEELDELTGGDHSYRYPCYWELWRMGLWDSSRPDEIGLRIDHEARSARDTVYPRELVETELLDMFSKAEKQFPALSGKASYLLYGPAEKAYASYRADKDTKKKFSDATGKDLVRGKDTDRMGVLAQKIPNFDNRSPSSCALIPRMRVAKASPRIHRGEIVEDSLLPAEVTLLMKLINLRYEGVEGQQGFTAEQVGTLYRRCIESMREKVRETVAEGKSDSAVIEAARNQLKLTKTALGKFVEKDCGGRKLLNHEMVDPPRVSGRSRFSRPALRIVRDLLLSGQSPREFREEVLKTSIAGNTDPRRGLVEEDLDFLSRMGDTWEGIYLPDGTLARSELMAGGEKEERAEAIQHLIASQIDPIVRHRLTIFFELLRKLETGDGFQKPFGVPDRVVLEFVREDFMGPKRKMELGKFQRERRKKRAEAAKKAVELGGSKKDVLKLQLLEDQGWQCLYTGENFGQGDLDALDVDHIVPRSAGGPDAYYNFAVCRRKVNNDEKGDRTPYDWLSKSGEWDAYVERVKSKRTALRNKKVRLLTLEEAPDLVDRYQKLAETAWIAKLAQAIVCLHFGWPLNFAGTNRKVVTLPGGLTHRVADRHHLYGLLNQEIADLREESSRGDLKAAGKREEKVRKDNRHHALDAMVLSFLPAWTADRTKRVFHRLPDGVDRLFFEQYLGEVLPLYICFANEPLRETIYAERRNEKGEWIPAIRRPVFLMAFKESTPDGMPKGFSLPELKKQASRILDPVIRCRLLEFAERGGDEEEWEQFVGNLRGSDRGPVVRKVTCLADKTRREDFIDLSKDGKGQWRTSKEGHKGQFVYLDRKGVPRVRPVRVFESVESVQKEVLASADVEGLVGFFQTKCVISLTKEVEHGKYQIAPGRYLVNSIMTDGRCSFVSGDGSKFIAIPLKKLIPAGFERVQF